MSPEYFFAQYNPRCFHHSTDTRNLDSIKKHGLLSLREIMKRRVEVSAIGSIARSIKLDEKRGLTKFVHICFLPEHPMEHIARKEKRFEQTTLIRVSRDILFKNDVRFSHEVANRRDGALLTFSEASKVMDFEVLYKWMDWKNPDVRNRKQSVKKYEILVPTCVSTEYLSLEGLK